MADIRNSANCRETVCISCNRILDSCRDKDCFENVRVYLDDCGQELVEKSSAVRVKCANVVWTQLSVDSVQFNRGFYTVTVRFYVRVVFEGCLCPGHTQEAEGIAVAEKKVVLYGGDGCVNTFRSHPERDGFCAMPPSMRTDKNLCCDNAPSLPTAVCEVADPVVLDARILDKSEGKCCCCCCCSASEIPEGIWSNGSPRYGHEEERILAVSLGFFSVIRLERPGQFIINATEYSVPEKECCEPPENDPCAMFRRMHFPVGEFSSTSSRGNSCACGKD